MATKLDTLRQATARESTGGLLPDVDRERRDAVRRAVLAFLAPNTGWQKDVIRQELDTALGWLEEHARLCAGQERMPADVEELVRDLQALEYCQRRVEKVRGWGTEKVALDKVLRRAAADRVERWLNDSGTRRERELKARVAARIADEGGS